MKEIEREHAHALRTNKLPKDLLSFAHMTLVLNLKFVLFLSGIKFVEIL